jgi:hypothetical protein
VVPSQQDSPTFLLACMCLCPSSSMLLHWGALPGPRYFTLKLEAAVFAEILVSYHIMTQCHNMQMEAANLSEMLIFYHITT